MKLSIKPYRLSQLATDLNATMQESHRNINRLIDSKLVKKTGEGELLLTPYGEIIVSLIPNFNFPFKHKDYFQEHTLSNLPLKFIQRIGALDNSEYIHGMVAVIELWKQIYNESSEYIYGMLPQIPLDLIESIIPKIKKDGIKFNYILPQKAVVPKKRTELLKDMGFYDLLKNEKRLVERRMIDRVQVAVVLNEKQSTAMFPASNDKTVADMNSMFYSKENASFHEWCLDYFRYCWYNSKSFDESKLLEV